MNWEQSCSSENNWRRQSVSRRSRSWKRDGDVHLFIDFHGEQLESLAGIFHREWTDEDEDEDVTNTDVLTHMWHTEIVNMHECLHCC